MCRTFTRVRELILAIGKTCYIILISSRFPDLQYKFLFSLRMLLLTLTCGIDVEVISPIRVLRALVTMGLYVELNLGQVSVLFGLQNG